MNKVLLSLLLWSGPSLAQEASPVTYQLLVGQSQLYVQVFKDPDTMGAGLSHDHVIMATGWSGTITWDEANPAACRVDIRVPVRGLIVDEPTMRTAVGYESMLSDGQRGDVRENMLARDQIDGDSNPNITFTANRCTGGSGNYQVHGRMTIRGQSRPMVAPMQIRVSGREITARGSVSANQSDFGFEPYSAMFGQLKNRDEMRFTIVVKGSAR